MVQENTPESRSSNTQDLDALRKEITDNAIKKWRLNGGRGIFEWATGLGKTKAAIEAIKVIYEKDNNCKVLFLCPTIAIIANAKAEFVKFNEEHLLNNIEFACYASIKNYFTTKFSLIVFDEIHNLSSPIRLLFLKNCRSPYLLGLSAKVPIKLVYLFNPYIKIVDSKELKDVKGLVAEFKLVNVAVEFTDEERKQYIKLTDSINSYKEFTGSNHWKLINKRKDLINSAKNKVEAAKFLVNLFDKEKGIIFSLNSETADLFKKDNCIVVHSKVSKKEIYTAVSRFNSLEAPAQISAVRMYDEGVTINGLSYAIIHSSYSVETQFIQRVGRTLRKDTEKESLVFRLYVKNTIEEKWLENSQKSFKNIIQLNNFQDGESIIRNRK